MRQYTTRRQGIIDALVTLLKTIDGSGDFLNNLYNNVYPKLKFWDEIDEFPSVYINSGSEVREYHSGGYKDRFLTVYIKVYVKRDEAWRELDEIMEDIETVIEANQALTYLDNRGNPCHVQQMSVVSINTDEGVLEPLGAGEIALEVRY